MAALLGLWHVPSQRITFIYRLRARLLGRVSSQDMR